MKINVNYVFITPKSLLARKIEFEMAIRNKIKLETFREERPQFIGLSAE